MSFNIIVPLANPHSYHRGLEHTFSTAFEPIYIITNQI